MNKGLLLLMLLLGVVLALSCRSGPGASPEVSAVPPDTAQRLPESPGESDPPQPSQPSQPPPQPPAAAERALPPDATLPRPAPRKAAAEPAGGELPLPALAAGSPMAELNRMPPATAWPPLDSYWRPTEQAASEAGSATEAAAPEPAAAVPAAAAAVSPPAAQTRIQTQDQAPAKPAPAPGSRQETAAGPQSPAGSTPDPPAAGSNREILARLEDRVEVVFGAPGWLFLGFDEGVDSEAISFLSRESGGGQTSFIFRVHERGVYTLGFQLQDAADGSVWQETVVLNVLPEQEFDRQLAASRGGETATDPKPDYTRAEQLYSLGELDLALIEFIRHYREEDSYANDRIAAIYLAGGEYEAALKYYSRNLEDAADQDYRGRAVLGVMRAGLGLEDEDLVREIMEDFLALRSLPIASELVAAARLLLGAGRHAAARALLQEYRTRYPGGKRMDEVLFLLGRLYEQDTPLRDLEASRAFYQRVYDEYPESLFSDEAYQRLRYLDRHFFHLQ
jgi:hypothetical protein